MALSNTRDFFKIKIEAPSDERKAEAMERVNHFTDKYKIALQQVPGKETFYILGYEK